MEKSTFEWLELYLGPHLIKYNGSGQPQISVLKQLQICIWTLAKQETYRYNNINKMYYTLYIIVLFFLDALLIGSMSASQRRGYVCKGCARHLLKMFPTL